MALEGDKLDLTQLFLQRYDVLCEFWLEGIWEGVPDDLKRLRPHPQVNSIAWNLWHLTRVEDAGLNRFVADRRQILDEGAWLEKLNLPWRHHGSGMSFAEVDELNRWIDLKALRAYAQAVQARTREIVAHISQVDLDARLQPERVRDRNRRGAGAPSGDGSGGDLHRLDERKMSAEFWHDAPLSTRGRDGRHRQFARRFIRLRGYASETPIKKTVFYIRRATANCGRLASPALDVRRPMAFVGAVQTPTCRGRGDQASAPFGSMTTLIAP